MKTILDAFFYGLGVGYGVLWVGLVIFIWQAVGKPFIEWCLEWYEQRVLPAHPYEARSFVLPPQGEIVVISDLHIDTWDRASEGRPARERAFFAFLRAIEPTTMELYVNGDLLDTPPHREDTWQGDGVELRGSILPKYETVLAALAEMNNREPLPVTVSLLYGNHDMASSGLRFDLVKRPQLVRSFRLPFNMAWYPNVVLGVPYDPTRYGQEDHRFYMDHGHFYDPVLLLYLRDFLLAAIRADLRRALTSLVLSGQRRGGEHEPIPEPGIAPSRAVTRDQRISYWLTRYRWRWKARRVLSQRSQEEVRQGHRAISGALFGHTHLPDRYTYRWGAAKGMTYVNTGDWSADTGHGTYTVMTQDGVITQYDWLDAGRRAPHHRGE